MSKNRNLPENIIKLKNQFETGNNLIDYFLLCGCEPSILYKEKFFYNLSNDKDTNLNKLSEIIKPKILSKFPEFVDTCINEELLSYCFPYGFQPYYDDSGNKLMEEIFSVILDNNIFSSEYPQKYMTCLLFYENLAQFKELYDAIYKNKNNSISSIKPKNNDKYKYYFIPKSIVIISKYPYTTIYPQILNSIYNYFLSKEQQIPLEKIITNLVIEVPTAPRGLSYIDFTLINNEITLKRSNNNNLLLTDIDLKNFYCLLSLDVQIEILKHLLLGSKIIIFSENINHITEIMIAFLFLLFPFKYPFYVTSFLNRNNYNIIESVSPFFVGINEVYNPEFFNENDINIDGISLLIVDLDNNASEFVSPNPIPDFPSRLISKLIKKIKKIENKYIKSEKDNQEDDAENEEEEDEDNENEDPVEKFNKIYQKTFFIFICDIIKNYEQFLNMQYLKTEKNAKASINNLFNCDEFIKTRQSIESSFYEKFIYESQIFFDFIYRKMIPKNSQEIVDNLLVNDTMARIKNKTTFFKKVSTKFSESSEYIKKDRYDVPKLKELTEKEKIFIKNNIKDLNKKGQIIIEDSSLDISFKYILFPQLDFNIYFNNENANEYRSPPNFAEKIESINVDIISKSSIGQNNNRSLEMINYLYLTWLEVWAFTFSYMDNKEKHYRFNQLIEILNKVFHLDMDILNLIFDTLKRNSENDMILKLYQKIICLKINPSYFIYNIVSSIISKEQLNELNTNLNKISNDLFDDNNFKFKNCKKSPDLKRTFSSVEDNLEINKTLKIYSNFNCIKCREKINLINVCKNFSDIKNDILWVMCKCGQNNLPKITIKYGKELLRDNIYKTSYSDEIILYLPNNLKMNIKNTIMENFGTDLVVSEFRSQFKPLFWNFFWYCKIHQLDYEILLPYLNDIKKLRSIRYKNRAGEIFEIVYEDKYYEENMKKIDKYSENIYERFVNKSIQKKTIFINLSEINEINMNYIPGDEIAKQHNELNKSENIENVNNNDVQNNVEENANKINVEENENKINEEENKIENNNEEIKDDKNNEENLENQDGKEEEQKIENEDNNKEQEVVEEKEAVEKEGVAKGEGEGEIEGKGEGERTGEREAEVINESEEKNKEIEKEGEVKEVEVVLEKEEEQKEPEVEQEEKIEKIVEQKEPEVEQEEKIEIIEEQKEEQVEKEDEPKSEEEKNIELNIEKNENIEEEEQNDIKQEEIKEIQFKEKINSEQNDNNIEQKENPEINAEKEEEPKEECNIEDDAKEEDIKTNTNINIKKIIQPGNSQMLNMDAVNLQLKKIGKSALKKEPDNKNNLNYKLKKLEDQNSGQSTNPNVNSGETLIAELKKKLKKVGSTDV